MSVRDIEFESEQIRFGDAEIGIHRIINVHARSFEASHTHTHRYYYEIHVMKKGEYLYSVGDKNVLLKSGEMIIIKPNTEHKSFLLKNDVEIVVLCLSLKKAVGSEGFFRCFTDGLNKYSSKALPIPNALTRKIINYCASPKSNDSIGYLCHRKLDACEIAVAIFDICCTQNHYKYDMDTDFDIMLDTFVHSSQIRLHEMADRLGYSERQMSRKIKELYGKTLTEIRKEDK